MNEEELLTRALDGLLSDEEEAALAERLKRDPDAARQLMEAARHEALLRELVAEAKEKPQTVSPDRHPTTHRGGLLTMAAILLVSAMGFWALFSGSPAGPVGTPAATLPQDENRLREAWPKLVDAWRALDACKSEPMSDEHLKMMSKVHAAFEAAGWLDTQPDYAPAALKQLFKLRQGGMRADATADYARALGAKFTSHSGDSLEALLASVRKLQDLKSKGLDDEDNVQDAIVAIRTEFKKLGLTADDTPVWLRRRLMALSRALALGEGYPEPAKATAEQEKQIRGWISDLANGDIETREKATRELSKVGEVASPFLKEALKSSDKEVVERAKKILGVGHEPWKEAQDAKARSAKFPNAVWAPAPPPPPVVEPPQPVPETPKKDR